MHAERGTFSVIPSFLCDKKWDKERGRQAASLSRFGALGGGHNPDRRRVIAVYNAINESFITL